MSKERVQRFNAFAKKSRLRLGKSTEMAQHLTTPTRLQEGMPFVSLTRLRIRSIRFVPGCVIHTKRSLDQVKRAPGFRTGAVLADRSWTFWTMTAWDTQEKMREFMISGAHKKAMSFLLDWCDEASVAHWDQSGETLPSWPSADKNMRELGRPSKVKHPSPHHGDLTYRVPRTTLGGPIRKVDARGVEENGH
jgi:hypothetical protein